MSPQIKKILNISLPLLLGVFLVFYAYNKFTPEQITEMTSYFKGANYNYIILSSVFSLVGLFSRAYRWKYGLNYLGYSSNFLNNLMAISIGYLLNLTVPRSGEVSRALVLQKYQKISFDKSFGTIISERLIDLVCLLLFVGTAFLLQYNQLKDFLLEKIPFEKLLTLLAVLVIFGIIGIYLLFYSKWKFFILIRTKIKGLIEGVLSIFKMPNRFGFLFHTVIIWISYVLTFYFGTLALAETSDISLGVVMVSFVVGSLAVTFTNGGFGAFPLMISEVLLLYGISATVGTTFGWILWTSQTTIIVLMGGLSFLLLPIFNKNK
ncbi:lysylphosphatidylglycerol synthase transmembrane domain-containing protein [Flavobacterium sp. I3-2]|uniref:lysylphosphatidylglycerol synthase transmembrane domain-containing protein n=1 Tax=Flavobacterium sp. I3-2 TaxID=2748319 RepID=UPI0015AF5D98|nr:lysylphosphatidylglycerol synthase transmembrane domain-containing protein [Flavobacterium sp. I3-2]